MIGDVISIPPEAEEACDQLFGLLGDIGLTPSLQPPTTSFFRNANLTQYGGKADIVLMGATGSENTGQASGAAGLLASYGREVFGDDDPLSGNEIRQLLTMTAEDVLPANTGVLGPADKANPGWDPHFGYGRVNLAAAMKRIAGERIPPEAQLDAPDWFAPINVDRVGPEGLEVRGPGCGAALGRGRRRLGAGVRVRGGRSRQRVRAGAGRQRHRRPATGCSERFRNRCSTRLADTCDGSVARRLRAAGRRPSPIRPATPTRIPIPSVTRSRSGSRSTTPATRATSAAIARRCSPTATTATCPAGPGRWAPAPTPRRGSPARAARCRRASSTSTATTRWT